MFVIISKFRAIPGNLVVCIEISNQIGKQFVSRSEIFVFIGPKTIPSPNCLKAKMRKLSVGRGSAMRYTLAIAGNVRRYEISVK